MDELELLQRHRPEPAPSADVVDRHRAHLRAEIASATDGAGTAVSAAGGDGPVLELAGATRGTGPRRRLLATAAAVTLVAIAAGAVAVAGSDDPRPSTATTAAPAATVPAGECGPLPFDLPLPDRFPELAAGPSGDGPSAPVDGQLVLHSGSATGSIEVRWPAGPLSNVVLDRDDSDAAGMSWTTSDQPRPTASGRHAFGMEVHDPRLSTVPQCQVMWFGVADDDPEVARLRASELFLALGAPGIGPFGGEAVPLVAGRETAVVLPEVPPCDAPPGVDHVDRVGGPVDMGRHPTSEEALRAFVDSTRVEEPDPFGVPRTRATVAEDGYVETSLPDGSIAYVRRSGLGVTIVHVSSGGEGWTVDRWEATGC